MRKRGSVYRPGVSYRKRVVEINNIYDRYAKTGLSNREIWRRYIYPTYGITERQFYNILKADVNTSVLEHGELFLNFLDEGI